MKTEKLCEEKIWNPSVNVKVAVSNELRLSGMDDRVTMREGILRLDEVKVWKLKEYGWVAKRGP